MKVHIIKVKGDTTKNIFIILDPCLKGNELMTSKRREKMKLFFSEAFFDTSQLEMQDREHFLISWGFSF